MASVGADELHWYVAKTNVRCEERAQASIEAEGYTAYVPISIVEKRHNRTKQWQEHRRVLLVGYLFLGMPADERQRHWGVIRKCDGVKDILGRDTGAPLRIPTSEVMAFMEKQALGDFDIRRRSSVKRQFTVDEQVVIGSGPFADITGVIRDVRGRHMCEVMINLLGSLVPVHISERELRKVA